MNDVFDIAHDKIGEWEGGREHFNPETNMWTAYDDVIGGNIPTAGPGITGQIGGQDIQIGQQYPADAVKDEYRKRMQGDYNWLASNVGNSWVDLNPNQQASVMSLLHNVGSGALGKSKAFEHLKGGNLEGFAHEAFDPTVGFVKAGGKVVKGLQNRRGKEKDLFFTDMAENAFN
tara:strand:+ start:3940 stop:4461 length:522 start_codon:yes stop_codon:yes gene_type:complete